MRFPATRCSIPVRSTASNSTPARCKYIALNPVGAGLCEIPFDYPWLELTDEGLVGSGTAVETARTQFAEAVDALAARIRENRRREWKAVVGEGFKTAGR